MPCTHTYTHAHTRTHMHARKRAHSVATYAHGAVCIVQHMVCVVICPVRKNIVVLLVVIRAVQIHVVPVLIIPPARTWETERDIRAWQGTTHAQHAAGPRVMEIDARARHTRTFRRDTELDGLVYPPSEDAVSSCAWPPDETEEEDEEEDEEDEENEDEEEEGRAKKEGGGEEKEEAGEEEEEEGRGCVLISRPPRALLSRGSRTASDVR